MKLKILMIPVINLLINIFKYLWVPIIISIRDRSREVVYNYWLQNNLAFRLPNDIQKVSIMKDSKVINVYKSDKFTLVYQEVSKFRYYWYLIFVYIWIDDTLSADFISDKLAVDILESEYLTNLYRQEISRTCKLGKGNSFTNYNSFDRNNLDISIGLLYVILFTNSNNNFKNIFYYNYTKETMLNIGYKKEVNINNINMYKWGMF